MKAPIVVVSDDVDLSTSVEAAEAYLEPPEVRAAGLTVLDATGRHLRAVVVKRWLAEGVRIEADPGGGDDVPALHSALVGSPSRTGLAWAATVDCE